VTRLRLVLRWLYRWEHLLILGASLAVAAAAVALYATSWALWPHHTLVGSTHAAAAIVGVLAAFLLRRKVRRRLHELLSYMGEEVEAQKLAAQAIDPLFARIPQEREPRTGDGLDVEPWVSTPAVRS